jgi:transposase-like protein
MTNRSVWRYPENFRQTAMERFKCCENVVHLAKELGVPRQTLYRWHEESERDEGGEEPVLEKSRESRLRTEIRDLKRLLVEKTLEADFFEGALQKIAAQRREGRGSGEPAFTTTSGA